MTNDHAAEDVRGSFTPLMCSAECVFCKESSMFQKNYVRHCRWNGGRPLFVWLLKYIILIKMFVIMY